MQAASDEQRAQHTAELESERAEAREAQQALQQLAQQLAAALEDCAADAENRKQAAAEQLNGLRSELAAAEALLQTVEAANR
jgi:vacuolar-type H+-ATPase subunit E/Vma4